MRQERPLTKRRRKSNEIVVILDKELLIGLAMIPFGWLICVGLWALL